MPSHVMRRCGCALSRRSILMAGPAGLMGVSLVGLSSARAADEPRSLPRSVGGEAIPDTDLAMSAAALARRACEPYLFNHSLRTYAFAAMLGDKQGLKFDREALFVGCALHDIGLTPGFETKGQPFEMDSADAARALMTEHGEPSARVERVADAIALHTSALSDAKGPDIALLGDGAAADVTGSGLKQLNDAQVAAVLAAFPRLDFKRRFENALKGYCTRKPRAQAGTWTDAYCRVHAPGLDYPDLAARIEAGPFPE